MEYRPSYQEVFWKLFEKHNYKIPKEEDQHFVFIFELFSNQNRIIVQGETDDLLLHGVRDMKTLKEVDPLIFCEKYGFIPPKSFSFNSLNEVIDAASKLDPLKQEGYVVVDPHFNRVKVKSQTYVSMHLLHHKNSDSTNAQRLLCVIQDNEGSEFLSYFPQWVIFNFFKIFLNFLNVFFFK